LLRVQVCVARKEGLVEDIAISGRRGWGLGFRVQVCVARKEGLVEDIAKSGRESPERSNELVGDIAISGFFRKRKKERESPERSNELQFSCQSMNQSPRQRFRV